MLKVTSKKISRETRINHLNYSSFTVVILLWLAHSLTLFRKKKITCPFWRNKMI